MKFKGLTSVVLAGVTAMSMSVPVFAAEVSDQKINQTQAADSVIMVENADNIIAINNDSAQSESSTNSKIDILGDENGGPVTRGATAPTTLWDWYDGDYNGSCLPLYRGRGVYTNYKFKPTAKKLTVSLELYADEDWTDNRKLTVYLYKRSGSSWISAGQKTFRFVPVPDDQYKTFPFSHTFTGLDNSTEYCVRLYNDSTIHDGYVDREYAIGADLCISAS